MTAKQVLDYSLIEQNKIESPSLEIIQYNYFFNKAIDNVLKLNYGYYDINQLQTDKLYTLKKRVTILIDMNNLEGTVVMDTGNPLNSYSTTTLPITLTERGIKFLLPDDYWHLLSAKVVMQPKTNGSSGSCNTGPGSRIERALKRGTSDLLVASLNNAYNRPAIFGRSGPGIVYYEITDNPQPPSHIPFSNSVPGVNNGEIEVITGLRHNNLDFYSVVFDYIKVYDVINLTEEQLFLDVEPGGPDDISQVMEFTNSVCRDIITELSKQLAGNAKEADKLQIVSALGPQDLSAPNQGAQ